MARATGANLNLILDCPALTIMLMSPKFACLHAAGQVFLSHQQPLY